MRPVVLLTAAVGMALGCRDVGEVLTPSDGSPDDGAAGAGQVPAGLMASDLSAGNAHACAVGGAPLYCWGDGSDGRLGLGDDLEDRLSPVLVDDAREWRDVSAGGQHTCGRTVDGEVLCWGDNRFGQLGTGDLLARHRPVVVDLPSAARQIETKFDVTCAILQDASLWCWGNNTEGQLGQDDAFLPAGEEAGVATPVRVLEATDWLSVSPGQGHVCGIRAPGTLWCWGRNSTSELGLGADRPVQIRSPQQVGDGTDWKQVAAGLQHTCAVRADGSAWCWGGADHAQLGLGDMTMRAEPTQVGTARDHDSIATTQFSTCSIRGLDRALWCWGRNIEGQLGLGHTSGVGEFMHQLDPELAGSGFAAVSVGLFFACALEADAQVACTGANADGQLGKGDTSRASTFTNVSFSP